MAPVSWRFSKSEYETAVFESGFIAGFVASSMVGFMAAFQAARFHGQFHIHLVGMYDVHHLCMVHGLLLRALHLIDWRLVRILTSTGSGT